MRDDTPGRGIGGGTRSSLAGPSGRANGPSFDATDAGKKRQIPWYQFPAGCMAEKLREGKALCPCLGKHSIDIQ